MVKIQKFIKFNSPAKLNLILKIIRKRNDGYHELQSLFTFINLYDELFFKIYKSDSQIIEIENPKINCNKEEDLIYIACKKILPKEFSATIKVEKKIPHGAGLGGGSSNAATTLIAINKLCSLHYPKSKLSEIGISIGADIPFFIQNSTGLVEGIGENIYPMPIPISNYLLCYPGVPVSTSEIFAHFKLTNKPKEMKITTHSNFNELEELHGNDLESTVLSRNSHVNQLHSYLKKFGTPRITGTGSCCFLKLNENIKIQSVLNELPENVSSFLVKGEDSNIAYNSFI
jgi:4-diphosphocytidyl-2-C-methyl-D-erythritol kinase